MTDTRQDIATFEAEARWAEDMSLRPLGLRPVLAMVHNLLPPQLSKRVQLQQLDKPDGTGRWRVHGSATVLPAGPIILELLIPSAPTIVTHEVAHILIDSYIREYIKIVHDPNFREHHLWVAERAFGKRRARDLEECYADEGLVW